MNTKHTPGPWKIGDIANDMMHPDCQGGEYRSIDSLHHSALAVVVTRMVDDDGHNDDLGGSALCRANAKLIAAAPELLEALENIHKLILGKTGMYGDYFDSPAFNKIEAAIKKATE